MFKVEKYFEDALGVLPKYLYHHTDALLGDRESSKTSIYLIKPCKKITFGVLYLDYSLIVSPQK